MKTCKKLLAVTIALVLLVSTFVSGLVVSAAEPYSVTIADTEITAGDDATVNVTVDFNGDAISALHMLATVETDLAIADAEIVSVDYADGYEDPGDSELEIPALRIKNDGKNLEAGKILFESGVDGAVKATEVVFALTFADVAEGTYAIAINVESTDYNEADFAPLSDEGEIVVKPAHVCEGTVLSDNGNGTHDVKCECGEVVTAGVACEYVDGFCACGAKEPVTEPVETEIKIRHTVAYESCIEINYKVAKNLLEGCTDIYAIFQYETYNGKELVPDQMRAEAEDWGNDYVFTYDRAPAAELGIDVIAVVYATKADGTKIKTQQDVYCYRKYAYNTLAKDTTDAKTKRLIVDALRYGAACQIEYEVLTNSLVTAELTPEYEAFGTDTSIPVTAVKEGTDTKIENPLVTFNKSLVFGSTTFIRFYMTVDSSITDIESLALNVSYVDMFGNKKSFEIAGSEFSKETSGKMRQYYDFGKVAPADMRAECSAFVTKDGVQISDTIEYGIETYCSSRLDQEILCAMLRYSDSAKAYFTK